MFPAGRRRCAGGRGGIAAQTDGVPCNRDRSFRRRRAPREFQGAAPRTGDVPGGAAYAGRAVFSVRHWDAHSRCRDPWRTGKRRNRARRCKQGVSRNPRRHFRNERRLVRQRYFPQRNAMEKGMAISALIPFGGDASINGMQFEKTRIRRRSIPLAAHPRQRSTDGKHAPADLAHGPNVVSGGNAPHLLAPRIQRDARCMLLLEHIL